MFCHLNYKLDKEFYRNFFFDNFSKAKHHKTKGSEILYWLKLFPENLFTAKLIDDLNLNGLNILPRFSYQLPFTRLYRHIDIDRIVGINFNLMDDIATIHINNVPYAYEAALIDVGTKIHSVEPIETMRLVLKLAIRNPWDVVYFRLKEKNLLATFADDYISVLEDKDKDMVKL